MHRTDESEGEWKATDGKEREKEKNPPQKTSSATAAECDSAARHQLTSPDNSGEGLISIRRTARERTSFLSQQKLRSPSKGKVKNGDYALFPLTSSNEPYPPPPAAPFPPLHSLSLEGSSAPSALFPPKRGHKDKKNPPTHTQGSSLFFLRLPLFKRDGPIAPLSPLVSPRVIHTKAFPRFRRRVEASKQQVTTINRF